MCMGKQMRRIMYDTNAKIVVETNSDCKHNRMNPVSASTENNIENLNTVEYSVSELLILMNMLRPILMMMMYTVPTPNEKGLEKVIPN